MDQFALCESFVCVPFKMRCNHNIMIKFEENRDLQVKVAVFYISAGD